MATLCIGHIGYRLKRSACRASHPPLTLPGACARRCYVLSFLTLAAHQSKANLHAGTQRPRRLRRNVDTANPHRINRDLHRATVLFIDASIRRTAYTLRPSHADAILVTVTVRTAYAVRCTDGSLTLPGPPRRRCYVKLWRATKLQRFVTFCYAAVMS